MSTMAQMSRTCHPGQASPNFILLTSRRASRLPVLIAVLAAVMGLLADRLGLTPRAGAATPMAGVVGGRVLDAQGEPLAGATVTLVGGSVWSTVQTDALGHFVSPPLNPGTYSVRAELFGFEPGVPLSIRVPSERQAELTMALALAPLPGR